MHARCLSAHHGVMMSAAFNESNSTPHSARLALVSDHVFTLACGQNCLHNVRNCAGFR